VLPLTGDIQSTTSGTGILTVQSDPAEVNVFLIMSKKKQPNNSPENISGGSFFYHSKRGILRI